MRQFGRFLLVGVSNTLVSLVAYTLLIWVGTPAVLAAPVAFAVGAVNGYILNRRWTFAAHDTTRARVLYVCVMAGGATASGLLVGLFTHLGTGELVAYVFTIPPVTVSTFLANRAWTFADRGPA